MPKSSINAAPASGNIFDQTKIPQNVSESTVFPNVNTNISGGADTAAPVKQQKKDSSLWLIILAALAVGFFIWKKRQSGD